LGLAALIVFAAPLVARIPEPLLAAIVIAALTHALAISLAPDVRVNCVSPGWIATKDYDKLRANDHAQHPAGRVGKPEDVAEVVDWLLDRNRAGFMTGANVVIDGGMTRKMVYEA